MFDCLWCVASKSDSAARLLHRRHYSRRVYRRHRNRRSSWQFIGSGEYLLLVTAAGDAVMAFRKFINDGGQVGVNCSIFRNESPLLASDLIKEGQALAWQKWPGERLYTYVDPKKIRSSNPGCCFKKAGWRRCGVSAGGLLIFEAAGSH